MEWTKGAVVRSIRGHDEGLFAVVRLEDAFAYLANGKQRPLDKPKKKNLKHLQAAGMTLDLDRIQTDRQLRKALRTAFEEEDLSWPKKM
ncbi:MAG TPA: KOW domain-containing RNA-binding protein [Candidatus Merdivicinus faecavium]|nr:KOW domain-containing RNA-binding protein [Candidatus Merdivicinus faecavium]